MKAYTFRGIVGAALVLAGGGIATAQTATPRPAQAGQAAHIVSTRDERLGPQGFSVVLVVGDLQGGPAQDNVPPAARKALADMKDFLPYKSYRLIDVQYTLCCSRGSTPMSSRLKGPDDREYDLAMTVQPDLRSRTAVRFLLREAWSGIAVPGVATGVARSRGGSSGASAQGAAGESVIAVLMSERARVEQQLQAAMSRARQRQEVGLAGAADQDAEVVTLRTRLAELNIKAAEAREAAETRAASGQSGGGRAARVADRGLIDTSFTMDIGETVVVGTSRLSGGDKALIALLTAVPRATTKK